MNKEKKPSFFHFGKKEKKIDARKEKEGIEAEIEQEVEEIPEEVASASPAQKFQRKRRLVEKQEEASIEEVKEAVSKSIFKKDITDKDGRDLLGKQKATGGGTVFHMGSKEEVENMVMGLSQEIADAFGVQTVEGGESLYEYQERVSEEKRQAESDFSLFDTTWKPEEKLSESEEETEETNTEETNTEGKAEMFAPSVEETKNQRDVLKRLQEVTALYQESQGFCEKGFCEIETVEDSVQVVKTEKGLLFSNYRVFVDGVQQLWDTMFEVKLPKGSQVEVATGVCLKVPQGVQAELCGIAELEEKHALRFLGGSTGGEVVAFFQADEGAYVSKIGRIVQCQFVGD